MEFNSLKNLELTSKHILEKLVRKTFPKRRKMTVALSEIHKILVFRLDQRIGNGILTLSLLRAIKKSCPDVELHLMLHQPVAQIIQKFAPGAADVFWPYHQKKLLSNPLRFYRWLMQLRKESFDLIVSSHNPDNFSVSQAILGRWCKPGILAGFRWKESPAYYDVAVLSSVNKHYSEAHVDIWRFFDPHTEYQLPKLTVSNTQIQKTLPRWNILLKAPSALFWLGATGGKALPVSLVVFVYDQIRKQTDCSVQFALGMADVQLLYEFPNWLREKVLIWRNSLEETVMFFSTFQLFVSGDTGPMHLATALDIPTLTLFIDSRLSLYGYNDGRRHFSLSYKGREEDYKKIKHYLKRLSGVL